MTTAEPAPGAARGAARRGLPLGTRLFLLAGALVGVPLTVAIGVTAWRAQHIAGQSVRDALEASHTARVQFDQQRARQLRLIVRLVASDPAFVAYVAEGDPLSVADLLEERRRSLGCDFAIVLDRTGRVVARTDRPGTTGADLSGEPLVAEALDAGEASGVWRDGGRLYAAVAAPLLSGLLTPEGTLVAGFALDDAVAVGLKRIAGAEVCYVAAGPEGARVTASTLGASGGALVSALDDGLKSAMAGRGTMIPRLWLERRMWGARVEPLWDARGGAVGAVVTLASLDGALAPYRRIQEALLVVGLLAMLAAFAASWMMARRLSRPLERLAAAADAAREGRTDVPIESGGPDEIGRLAAAFRSLLAELREERELAAFLAARSRTLPHHEPPRSPGKGALTPGTLFAGRFEVLDVIGVGGMAVVYRARDREIRDVVALKTLLPGQTDPAALERLKTELRLARRITHRHVVRLHDFGTADGTPFLSMEYVEGTSLREVLHAGVPPLPVALRIAHQIATGLEAAHEIGVQHRDLKPENVVFERSGNAKLMDFGIAAVARRGAGDGAFSGTPGYAAPEVMQGLEAGAAADVFSFGVLFHELLTGRRPWVVSDAFALLYAMENETPDTLTVGDGTLPPALLETLRRCLAPDPARRFADARALRAALDAVKRS